MSAPNALLRAEAAARAARIRRFADDLVDHLVCRTPGYGVPGHPHCAACCYGTGVIITCDEDQALVDAAKALHYAADLLVKP